MKLILSIIFFLLACSSHAQQGSSPKMILPKNGGHQDSADLTNALVTHIAVLGCHSQQNPAPALPFFANVIQPDYAIWVGDNVYADTETDPEHIRTQLNIMAQKPGFAELKASTPFLVTWDDHDFGLNDAGGDYLLKKDSREIHRAFWELENEIPQERSGVFYAKSETLSNGKVIQFILTDGRYNRGNPKHRDADALGEEQWTWLEQVLSEPADLRLFISGYQVLLKKPTRWEAWVKVGKSRERLYALLEKKNIDNLLFVTGDQHYVEVLRSAKSSPFHTYEFMAAGINQTERPGYAPNRVAGPDKTLHSAPVMEVYWTEEPFVRFLNYQVETGNISLDFTINLADIRWKN